MIQKIKNVMLSIMLPFAFAMPVALPVAVGAADIGGCGSIKESLNQGINAAAEGNKNCTDPSSGGITGIGDIASKIVNFLSVLVGVVAVIMIIVGGFRYITSGGDSNKVGGAKNTLIYAIVGLIIVALAQFIVHFVLSNIGT